LEQIKRTSINVLLRTKYNGAALQRYRYTPFGEQQVVYAADDLGAFVVPMVTWGELARADGAAGNTNGKLLDRHNYTGHESISHLNLIHMGGRVYDPQIGRMLQADIVVQFPHLVQSYNRYAYVLNNPLSYSDPSGYMLFNDDGSIAESPSGNTASENNAKSDNDSNTGRQDKDLGDNSLRHNGPNKNTGQKSGPESIYAKGFFSRVKDFWDNLTAKLRPGLKFARSIAGKIWALPNTIIGIAVGSVGYVVGTFMGTNPYIDFKNNAIQFHNIAQYVPVRHGDHEQALDDLYHSTHSWLSCVLLHQMGSPYNTSVDAIYYYIKCPESQKK
jgi:RHS repeat-associated protein